MTERVPCTSCGTSILPATANATGGVCMPCKQRGVPPEQPEIVKRAYATPARCLLPFTVLADGVVVNELEQRIESTRFQLACTCGSHTLAILGYPMKSPAYPDMDIFAAPVTLRCTACGREERLFDPKTDGYDGEIDSSAGVTGAGEPAAYACKACGQSAFDVAVSLEYSVEDEEMDDWDELAERPQDFFTWFSLYGKCSGCGQLSDVTDYECA